jgi:hypothetical protein
MNDNGDVLFTIVGIFAVVGLIIVGTLLYLY